LTVSKPSVNMQPEIPTHQGGDMTRVQLDTTKLLGFRVAQEDSSRIGIKLGASKDGVTKAAPTA